MQSNLTRNIAVGRIMVLGTGGEPFKVRRLLRSAIHVPPDRGMQGLLLGRMDSGADDSARRHRARGDHSRIVSGYQSR